METPEDVEQPLRGRIERWSLQTGLVPSVDSRISDEFSEFRVISYKKIYDAKLLGNRNHCAESIPEASIENVSSEAVITVKSPKDEMQHNSATVEAVVPSSSSKKAIILCSMLDFPVLSPQIIYAEPAVTEVPDLPKISKNREDIVLDNPKNDMEMVGAQLSEPAMNPDESVSSRPISSLRAGGSNDMKRNFKSSDAVEDRLQKATSGHPSSSLKPYTAVIKKRAITAHGNRANISKNAGRLCFSPQCNSLLDAPVPVVKPIRKDLSEVIGRVQQKMPSLDPRLNKPSNRSAVNTTVNTNSPEKTLIPIGTRSEKPRSPLEPVRRIAHRTALPTVGQVKSSNFKLPEIPVSIERRPGLELSQPEKASEALSDVISIPMIPDVSGVNLESSRRVVSSFPQPSSLIVKATKETTSGTTRKANLESRDDFVEAAPCNSLLLELKHMPTCSASDPDHYLGNIKQPSPPRQPRCMPPPPPASPRIPQAIIQPRVNETPRNSRQEMQTSQSRPPQKPFSSDLNFYLEVLDPLLSNDCEKLLKSPVAQPASKPWNMLFDNYQSYRATVLRDLRAQILFTVTRDFKREHPKQLWKNNPVGLRVANERVYGDHPQLKRLSIIGQCGFLSEFAQRDLLVFLYTILPSRKEDLCLAYVVHAHPPKDGIGHWELDVFVYNKRYTGGGFLPKNLKPAPDICPNTDVAVYRLNSLENFFWMHKAVNRLESSSFLRSFLFLEDDNFQLTAVANHAVPVSLGTIEQRDLVATVVNSIMSHSDKPKIAVLHLPPGTGEDRVLTGILYSSLNSGRNTKFLITVPTIKAIPNLVRKIDSTWKLLDMINTPKMVFFQSSKEFIPLDVRSYSLAECLRGSRSRLQESVPDILQNLQRKITEFERRLEGIRFPAERSEIQESIAELKTELEMKKKGPVCGDSHEGRHVLSYCPSPADLKLLKSYDLNIFVTTVCTAGISEIQRVLGPFDCLIMCQAGQVAELTTALSIAQRENSARKVVLIGHKWEIPVDEHGREIGDSACARSFFERINRMHGTDLRIIPRLTVQYDLILNANQLQMVHNYYSTQTVQTVEKLRDWPFESYIVLGLLKGVAHQTAELNWEVDRVYNIISIMMKECPPEHHYVILTRSVEQREATISMLNRKNKTGIKVRTAAEYQGWKSNIVIYCAFAPPGVDDELERKRLYVALTSASKTLLIVGFAPTLSTKPPWNEWVLDAQRMGNYGEISVTKPERQIQAYVLKPSYYKKIEP